MATGSSIDRRTSRRPGTSLLIVIAGADGAGKSSLTRALSRHLDQRGQPNQMLDKWQVYDFEKHPACRFLDGVPLGSLRSYMASMPVPARTMFIFWTMFMTMREELIDDAEHTLVDGYWYKHAASELIYGAPDALIDAATATFRKPDVVFLLDVDPAVAWRRKVSADCVDLVPYECGMDPHMQQMSFVRHQMALRAVLGSWADDFGWYVLRGERSIDQIAREALELISGTVGTGAHSRGGETRGPDARDQVLDDRKPQWRL